MVIAVPQSVLAIVKTAHAIKTSAAPVSEESLKTIIAGSRSIKKFETVEKGIQELEYHYGLIISEVVSGTCRGPDLLGEAWAVKNNVCVKRFPADWKNYGISAGFIRNKQMGDYADLLIAFWDTKSNGTKQMIDYMASLKKDFFVVNVKNEEDNHVITCNRR